MWPTLAPLGYRNVTGPVGKKMIEPLPYVAPLIVRLFATGTYSIEAVSRLGLDAGLRFRRSKDLPPTATVPKILRNWSCTGEFDWKGKTYQVREALRESHGHERRFHEAAIGCLRAESARLQHRLDTMYVDKLDGRIEEGFHERKTKEWRAATAGFPALELHLEGQSAALSHGVTSFPDSSFRNSSGVSLRNSPKLRSGTLRPSRP